MLEKHGLEAVLVGNAAASLQGAPVTTVDLDFLIRKTRTNAKKIKAVASDLRATLLRPCGPASGFVRLMRDDDLLQIDFMTGGDGVRSFERLRKRAIPVDCNGSHLLVEPLTEIPKRKKADRPNRDSPMTDVRRKPLQKPRVTRNARLAALKKESELVLIDQIRRRLALPPERRTNFLRKRVGFRASCL